MTVSLVHLLVLFLIFIRILAVFMTAPFFNSRSIPMVAKLGLAALLTLILLPVAQSLLDTDRIAVPSGLPAFLMMIAPEILLGVLIGYVSNLVFIGLAIASSLMGMESGFRAANVLSPFMNIPSSALDQFYSLLALTLFLIIDGHHMLLKAVIRTFEISPPGAFMMGAITTERLVTFSAQMFISALQIALPIIGTLLLTNLGLGLVARAVPQIQVFFVGLPLKVGLGFITMAFTLVLTLTVMKGFFADMYNDILLIAGP
jgi:flagellar biosynthetic protein FliR